MNTSPPPQPDLAFRRSTRCYEVRDATIGHSEEGRPLQVYHRGPVAASLRVMIMAGQHGDEPIAMEAARMFAARFDTAQYPDIGLAVLPCANPDGSSRNTRTNAKGLDLNRDHLVLCSAEVQAIHAFIQAWQPHLILDVHTYPTRRTHLLRQGLVYCHDVFLDVPTNPSLRLCLGEGVQQRFLETLKTQVEQHGFRCDRYTLVNRRGRVRHSTPDVVDARNALALRYGTFTVLVEGRQPHRRALHAVRQRTHEALQATLHEVIRWADRHHTPLTTSLPTPEPNVPVPIRARYTAAPVPRRMAFADEATGTIDTVPLPGRYTPTVTVTERIPLPSAYAIPNTCTGVLAVLQQHRFLHHRGEDIYPIERFITETVSPSQNPGRAPRRLSGSWSSQPYMLSGYHVFPTSQPGGHALAALLEPRAKYGLHRFARIGLSFTPGTAYPILRVH